MTQIADITNIIPTTSGVAPPNVPVIYAEGLISASITGGGSIVKLQLFSSRPDSSGTNKFYNQVVAEIVMPMAAFLFMVPFMQKEIDEAVSKGVIKQDFVDTMRQYVK